MQQTTIEASSQWLSSTDPFQCSNNNRFAIHLLPPLATDRGSMLHTIPVTLWASPKITNLIIKTCNAEYHGDAHHAARSM